jgi:hypothetical protein
VLLVQTVAKGWFQFGGDPISVGQNVWQWCQYIWIAINKSVVE